MQAFTSTVDTIYYSIIRFSVRVVMAYVYPKTKSPKKDDAILVTQSLTAHEPISEVQTEVTTNALGGLQGGEDLYRKGREPLVQEEDQRQILEQCCPRVTVEFILLLLGE